MFTFSNAWLLAAAALSAVAALLHVAIVFGGAPWYRFFGAGERMASAAEAGRAYPAIVTLGIALVLALWAAYALSGAGLLAPLPLLKWCLAAITAVYLLRGLAILPLFIFARAQVTPFLIWSSVICIGYGVVHLVGTVQVWRQL
ncbi:MAG: hypothetical protein CVU34_09380 [Betaproteobacteria bacterium HGW-Betaproteobacteria-7]|jgi:hypothetical protein|nr:MAG: hypothetical protein CVU34_09380 [Betaproteobacteria bacterium HGW-Betaproteobacteria-7]